MTPQLFPVPVPYPGRLAVVERPRGGDWLDADMRTLRAAGVDVLVSALVAEEQRGTWLEREAEAAKAAGIRFIHLPVSNLGVPLPPQDRQLPRIAAAVREGQFAAAHCYASVGRSPMLIASVMVLLGCDPDFAWEELNLARGRLVPDTLEQRAWPRRFATPEWRAAT